MKQQALALIQSGLTPAEVGARLGINPATVRVWKSRANTDKAKLPAEIRTPQPKAQLSVIKQRLTTQKPTARNYRRQLLIALLIAPTAASVQNAYHVGAQVMGDAFGAACLTAVLSLTALGFVLAGVRNWYTVPLAVMLIGYESFCNLTRIYAGLMIGGKYGTSEFLGRVCDVFGSGSHYTAVTLAGFTAVLLAAVQYCSLFELNRK